MYYHGDKKWFCFSDSLLYVYTIYDTQSKYPLLIKLKIGKSWVLWKQWTHPHTSINIQAWYIHKDLYSDLCGINAINQFIFNLCGRRQLYRWENRERKCASHPNITFQKFITCRPFCGLSVYTNSAYRAQCFAWRSSRYSKFWMPQCKFIFAKGFRSSPKWGKEAMLLTIQSCSVSTSIWGWRSPWSVMHSPSSAIGVRYIVMNYHFLIYYLVLNVYKINCFSCDFVSLLMQNLKKIPLTYIFKIVLVLSNISLYVFISLFIVHSTHILRNGLFIIAYIYWSIGVQWTIAAN